MNRKTFTIAATLSGLALGAMSEQADAAAFTDTFDSINPAWVTDRYEPEQFVSENFLGDNRLKISIDLLQHRAIEAHRGLVFHDSPGQGTRFTVLLPLSGPPDSGATPPTADVPRGNTLRRSTDSARVLER